MTHRTWREKMNYRRAAGLPMDFDSLIAAARQHTMSPDEIEEQRKSWVIGEMLLEHPDWDRATVERIYAEVRGRG